jgi:hypothetical protein
VDVLTIIEDGNGVDLETNSADQVVEGTGEEECLGAQGSWRVKLLNEPNPRFRESHPCLGMGRLVNPLAVLQGLAVLPRF